MTDERKNEIWAMLPEATKATCRRIYIKEEKSEFESYGRGYRDALADIFGSYNLTAQAEEKPKFKVGDKVSYFGQVATIFKAHCNGYDVIFGNGATLYNLPEATLGLYIEPNGESDNKSKPSQANPLDVAKSVEPSTKENACLSNSFQSFTDWNKYRLDLAKEIAVAIINTANKDARYGDTLPYVAVKISNEIVKRLKETEDEAKRD